MILGKVGGAKICIRKCAIPGCIIHIFNYCGLFQHLISYEMFLEDVRCKRFIYKYNIFPVILFVHLILERLDLILNVNIITWLDF